jgi:hypothetical protein
MSFAEFNGWVQAVITQLFSGEFEIGFGHIPSLNYMVLHGSFLGLTLENYPEVARLKAKFPDSSSEWWRSGRSYAGFWVTDQLGGVL